MAVEKEKADCHPRVYIPSIKVVVKCCEDATLAVCRLALGLPAHIGVFRVNNVVVSSMVEKDVPLISRNFYELLVEPSLLSKGKQ